MTFCANQVVGGRVYIRNDARILGSASDWVPVDSPDGKSFTFVPPERMSIAFAWSESPIGSYLQIFQLTADELQKLNCLPTNVGLPRVYTGTLAVPTGRSAQIWLGTGVTTRGSGSYTLQNSMTGASDLVAFLRIGTTSIEKFIVRRALDLPGGSAIDPIDFTTAEAVAPRLNTVTIGPAGTPVTTTSYRVVTKGTNAGLPAVVSSGTIAVAALPATLQTEDDFYVLAAASKSGGTFPEGRSVAVRFTNPVDRALVFGPPLSAATSAYTGDAAPATIRLTLPVQSEYAARADITVSQSDGAFIRSVSMTMTRAYRGNSLSWSFETPDPARLDLLSVRLNPNIATGWIATGASGESPTLFFPDIDGELTIREAFRDGLVGNGGAPMAGRPLK